ncbi:hypothetical protein [Salinibacterium sp.]|uniref:hypothetical protein n=1 Tax=Salinibacterium sp. TaxID=1915057 RepID=UPI00286D239C|nr:hypothetical protein [Salinibacterium sp.]
MNSTNRGMNRTFIFIIGLLLMVVGVAVAALSLLPAFRSGWQATAPAIKRGVDDVYAASPMFSTGTSWIGLGVIALLLVLIAALLVFIVKQGRGRTRRLIRDGHTENGVTIIDAAVAEDALRDALSDRPELISTSVSTYDVRGTPTLNVSVTARRGVSPKQVSQTVEAAVHALDSVLGREIPVVVQIGGAFRARTTASTRLQ